MIICMVFLAIFSALAVGMASMADTNAQLGRNQHQGSMALTGAQSGLEIMRYWLKDIEVPDTANTAVKLSTVASKLQNKLNAAGVTNIAPAYNSATNTLTIPIAALDAATGQNFGAVISVVDVNTLQAKITGGCGQASKQVNVNFDFDLLANSVFNFGVATKGPLSLSGQTSVGSSDLAIYASVYIEGIGCSGNDLTMTNKTSIAGDVSIADPFGTYSVTGEASINGTTGSNIEDNIHIGVPQVSFPTPQPENFLPYATGPEITSGTTTSHGTFNNCIIKSGSTVTFADDATINGILYIESSANVNFAGKATINGIIAGDGELSEYDGTSHLKFSGQVFSNDVSVLTGSEFDAIKTQTGTFIVAPGFTIDFTGQSVQLNGAVAGNGISFSGQSGGTIYGSIIDYSKDTMTMVGQSSLTFDRSGRDSTPAGFEPVQELNFVPTSYSESL